MLATLAMLALSGCQSPNFYYAHSMPKSLRLAPQANAQESDLTNLASATGGSDTIGPGDLLEVTFSPSLNPDDQYKLPVRVHDDGTAYFPNIGKIKLAGHEPQAAESLIRIQSINSEFYKNPTVSVEVTGRKVNRVRVLGAVKEPGLYELSPNASDLVSAIAAAKGLAENAGENVEVKNPVRYNPNDRPAVVGDPQVPYTTVSADSSNNQSGMRAYTVSLTSASTSTGNRYTVEDGAVVMVEKRDPAPIQVGGLVKKADTYDFPIGKTLTVLGAIQMAGGISNQLADKVYVIRPLVQPDQKARVQVSLRRAKKHSEEDIILGPGDIVLVEPSPGTVLMEALQYIRIGVTGSAPLF
ncbi:polysaccharide biosynthesis/export family protein [Fuerstiella marisgermanici]|uniref:Polysaccharide export protein n=1 Tax=Fuerstiella marisgermanici TaxID=1891926 RepID=A0A1P8WP20_9PLAN|nr:polysaccharide biosynthesis/export family protein [Fuerstiella marisgermanici]APZ95799.1 polysaccharide export protein [Fuerstiella marisgermanici]